MVHCWRAIRDAVMLADAHGRLCSIFACCRSSPRGCADAAGKAGKAERDVVSIAVAAGVRPSADAVETAQRHVLESQGPGATGAAAAAGQRAPMPVANQPPLRFQRRG